jgi:hypothetical protein
MSTGQFRRASPDAEDARYPLGGVYSITIDKPPSLRFQDLDSPLCPNCTKSKSREIRMKGPMPDPTGKSTDPVFVCQRCGTTMKDRRSQDRKKPEKK